MLVLLLWRVYACVNTKIGIVPAKGAFGPCGLQSLNIGNKGALLPEPAASLTSIYRLYQAVAEGAGSVKPSAIKSGNLDRTAILFANNSNSPFTQPCIDYSTTMKFSFAALVLTACSAIATPAHDADSGNPLVRYQASASTMLQYAQLYSKAINQLQVVEDLFSQASGVSAFYAGASKAELVHGQQTISQLLAQAASAAIHIKNSVDSINAIYQGTEIGNPKDWS
ncbi:hypothetical protein GQ54DRAFT_84163 [Martensiomyces pterosporus]|nr:hypothetical protein GQ54DRAFT_84163 [Martensiomyces pterosporus]